MTVRLITLSLRQVLRFLLLTCRSSHSKDIELLVLRQEFAVPSRQVPHPKTKRDERPRAHCPPVATSGARASLQPVYSRHVAGLLEVEHDFLELLRFSRPDVTRPSPKQSQGLRSRRSDALTLPNVRGR